MTAANTAAFVAVYAQTPNIGDDIQVLAALQFVPSQTPLVDRDRIGRARLAPRTRVILNGWFLHSPAVWPPPSTIDPLIVSFHASPSKFRGRRLDYLREQSRRRPVGARDLDTLALFQKGGIDNAYWSGCLTLTLRALRGGAKSEQVLAIDLADEDLAVLRRQTSRPLVTATQLRSASHRSLRWRLIERRTFDRATRISQAKNRLDEIAAAAVVVTTRLHVALPALALGTPLLFVTDKQNDPRLSSWLPHMHWCTADDFRAGRFDFDFASPPTNPVSWRAMAAELAATCSTYTGLAQRSYSDVT